MTATLVLEGLEDLSLVRPNPRLHPMTPPVGVSLLGRLVAPLRSRVRPWLRESAAGRAVLVSEGWCTATGELTARGVELHADLTLGCRTLTIHLQDEHGLRRGWMWAGPRLVVLAAEAGAATGGAFGDSVVVPSVPGPRDQVTFEVVLVGALPILLARWGGLVPSWNYDDPHYLPDPQTAAARLSDDRTPLPASADERLAELWTQPWTGWGVTSAQVGIDLQYVRIGPDSQYVVRARRDGSAVLAPRPGSLLWGDLQQVVHDLLRDDDEW